MSEVFISYARETGAYARKFAEALRASGFTVWYDEDLPAHRAFSEVIEERLREAKAVIVVWSSEAVRSQWVRAEADTARQAGTLIQLRVDQTNLPLPFSQIQCEDLTGWSGDRAVAAWRKVVASVEELVDRAQSPIRYARIDGVHIAYRVFGDGPHDIVLVPGTLSNVEVFWGHPVNEYLVNRLTSFARVIVFDKRGQGLSDRVGEQTLDERISDVKAVMDAAGSSQATIFGWSEGGAMSLMFSATYPDRTSSLVLYGAYASVKAGPWVIDENTWEERLQSLEAHWGEGILAAINAPSRAGDEHFVKWFAHLERATASPGGILSLFKATYEIDVRPILSSIHVPTLILHRTGDKTIPIRAGRYIAQNISGARFVELPGDDHLLQAFDQSSLNHFLDEIEEFITGTRHRPESERVLATVMFVDIVDARKLAAQMGDQQWRELLKRLHEIVGKELAAYQGRQVNGASDGVLETFQGPARAIRCACAIREHANPLGLRLRTGLHTGECELIGADVDGIAVQIGVRVAAAAHPDEVLVSSTVKDLVAGSGITFVNRGLHSLKGVSGKWHLFGVQL
jgi:pimeloyl-ACP methyl ester carboxylesterase